MQACLFSVCVCAAEVVVYRYSHEEVKMLLQRKKRKNNTLEERFALCGSDFNYFATGSPVV